VSVYALLITYFQDCSLSSRGEGEGGGGRGGRGRGGGSSREGETRPIIRYRRSVGNLIAAYHGGYLTFRTFIRVHFKTSKLRTNITIYSIIQAIIERNCTYHTYIFPKSICMSKIQQMYLLG
jgi:hypothetical protein